MSIRDEWYEAHRETPPGAPDWNLMPVAEPFGDDGEGTSEWNVKAVVAIGSGRIADVGRAIANPFPGAPDEWEFNPKDWTLGVDVTLFRDIRDDE